jgi:hypothetical protein
MGNRISAWRRLRLFSAVAQKPGAMPPHIADDDYAERERQNIDDRLASYGPRGHRTSPELPAAQRFLPLT